MFPFRYFFGILVGVIFQVKPFISRACSRSVDETVKAMENLSMLGLRLKKYLTHETELDGRRVAQNSKRIPVWFQIKSRLLV